MLGGNSFWKTASVVLYSAYAHPALKNANAVFEYSFHNYLNVKVRARTAK